MVTNINDVIEAMTELFAPVHCALEEKRLYKRALESLVNLAQSELLRKMAKDYECAMAASTGRLLPDNHRILMSRSPSADDAEGNAG